MKDDEDEGAKWQAFLTVIVVLWVAIAVAAMIMR